MLLIESISNSDRSLAALKISRFYRTSQRVLLRYIGIADYFDQTLLTICQIKATKQLKTRTASTESDFWFTFNKKGIQTSCWF